MASPPEYKPLVLLQRLARLLLGSENPAGAIYGIIVIAALLAAESGEHDSYLDAVASALIATALYWLAHAYAELLGGRLAARKRLTPAALARALAHDWPIARGAALPLAALVIAWVAGATQRVGVAAGLWSAVASLIVFELLAGVRARASGRELALDAGVGAAMGVAIIAMKIVLH
ncbi:MAG TPA: hypothetical protein VMD79_03205 [Solirubrobacteraceae bacterium]|nr:hypothetical protein [Solirubrobacteraceae bacterium]